MALDAVEHPAARPFFQGIVASIRIPHRIRVQQTSHPGEGRANRRQPATTEFRKARWMKEIPPYPR